MRRKIAILALALTMIVGIAPAALAHGGQNHHSCGAKTTHGIVYDGYSGGKFWYHTVGRETPSIWLIAEFDYIYNHYYRGGPPSALVYVYSHYNRVTCW